MSKEIINSNVHLCSFASPDLLLSKIRFIFQARKTKFYKSIKVYGRQDLAKKTREYIDFSLAESGIGYGYWCWKPEIVLMHLLKIPNEDILHYCDIGSVFNPGGFKIMKYYINLCEKYKFLAFQYKKPKKFIKKLIYPKAVEKRFTKKILFDYFKIKKNNKILNTPQYSAGGFFIKKNKKNIDFIKNWLQISKKRELIDNSLDDRSDKFVSPRNDQSIFSILCKLNKVFTLSAYEGLEPLLFKKKKIWNYRKNIPIQYKRRLLYINYNKIKKKILNKIFYANL